MPTDAASTEPLDQTSLRHVGPATAAILEEAAFSAADLRDGRVSVRSLLAAGVNAGVAERLRREYGLPWAYRWHNEGQALARRAAAMPDAARAERRWIAASVGDTVPPDSVTDDHDLTPEERGDLDWPAWPEHASVDGESANLDGSEPDTVCPRCGATLSRYELGDRVTVHCETCGYAGVPFTHGGEGAWRTAVDRLLRGERPPRQE